MKHLSKSLLCLLLVVLLAAAALTGCTESKTPSTEAAQTEAAQTEAAQTKAPQTETQAATDSQTQTESTTEAAPATTGAMEELGEGSKLFYFNVTFSDGSTSSYAVHTDAETVGEALVSLELIAGDESQYGLYVKTVGEETLDYDADGSFWAFYENGEFASSGVDSTQITDGATYAFVATKG